ncbi:biotin-dependent carboxyltransferase family protein [Aureispira]|nr:biotin-dependent carboxyltransferase family protein [Aureispira sp.]
MTKQTIFHFKQAGLYTSLQDMGWPGKQHLGIPIGGAMDRTSARTANWLVGNDDNLPVLEITLLGPKIIIEGDCQIALTGANMSPYINGNPLSMYETITVKNGSKISFGPLKAGCRTYLAIAGKLMKTDLGTGNEISIKDTTSLTLKNQIQKNNKLTFTTSRLSEIRKSSTKERPIYTNKIDIQVVPGPEFNTFNEESIKSFLNNPYTISNQSNRIGYRLTESLNHCNTPHEIISSGIIPGTIQITSSGQPIILMNDAPTIGGYARIANIISADLDKVAQLKPGDEISFILN